MHRIGIDLGGTKIEAIVLDETGNEISRKRVDTEQQLGYESILEKLNVLYESMVDAIDGQPHLLGIGTPGAASPQTGRLRNSNTLCLNGQTLQQDLSDRLGRSVAIENDANCFALAEAVLGAGQGNSMVFGSILGTGCGGGIVQDERIRTGRQSIAGEWGHASIDPNGPACYCGSRGCVETFISGSGLSQQWEEETGADRSVPEIVGEFRAGNEQAVAFLSRFFVHYGRAMANLINVLDPDIVVLGGGLSNIDELYTLGQIEVEKAVFNESLETPIVRNRLGDSAGVIGAALIAI